MEERDGDICTVNGGITLRDGGRIEGRVENVEASRTERGLGPPRI